MDDTLEGLKVVALKERILSFHWRKSTGGCAEGSCHGVEFIGPIT